MVMESKTKAIYFYKAYDAYGCFSNFSLHPIHCEGLQWPTVEHFYQAYKFHTTPDATLMSMIRKAATPEEAAAIGRDSRYSPRHDWERVKQGVMWQGLWQKFTTHDDIAEILLETAEAELIENSPVDYYWGCGEDGTGYNYLGKLLMKVRHQLRYPQVKVSDIS